MRRAALRDETCDETDETPFAATVQVATAIHRCVNGVVTMPIHPRNRAGEPIGRKPSHRNRVGRRRPGDPRLGEGFRQFRHTPVATRFVTKTGEKLKPLAEAARKEPVGFGIRPFRGNS